MAAFDRWVNKLKHDKLDLTRVGSADREKLEQLCNLLADRFPDVTCAVSHAARQADRHEICAAAIDLGIDLLAVRAVSRYKRGKPLIGRGLLDVWVKVLTDRFGSAVGTNAWFETRRRDIKTKLAKEGITLSVLFKTPEPTREDPQAG